MAGPLLLIGAGGALAILALAIRRPALACALLALAIPLSAGMARGSVVPVLRLNEALLLVVGVGFLVHRLLKWRPLTYSGVDIVIFGFCLLNVVIPWAVILLTRADAALDDWLVVLAPVQYLLVYLVYSRTEFTAADTRLFFNACMLASIPVAAVAAAQALDLPGVRDVVATYYPTAPQPSWDRLYRPASLLGHFSAVGAFGLLNLMLALALAATRQPGFPGWWLALVMGANMLSLVASETYAPLAALPIGAVAALLVARRVPWSHLAAGLPVLGAAGVVLWSSISSRIGSQFSGAGGLGLPETLQTRIDYWQGFFIPALLEHGPWFGTGTLIPTEVPRPLVNFVDNGYLWQLFRAGVPGLAALVIMLAAVAWLAWAMRNSQNGSHRVLGAVCLGGVVSIVVLDTTSEYLTFTGVSQEFWMLVGLLSGALLAWRSSAVASAHRLAPRAAPAAPAGAGWRGVRVPLPPPPQEDRGPVDVPSGAAPVNAGAAGRLDQPVAATTHRLRDALGRLGPDRPLDRSSATVLLGFGLARPLGFLFQVTAGRLLPTDGYGRPTEPPGEQQYEPTDSPLVCTRPPILMVAEELGATPDEGYQSFVRALEARLSASRPTVLHASRPHRWDGSTVMRLVSRSRELIRAARLPEVRAIRPAVVVYASRSSLTLPALVRARLLKRLCGGAPLAFVALQASAGWGLSRILVRLLAPDLLLLPTDRERDAVRALGIAAATVGGGVDLERFRPPTPGERSALRRKWGLSLEDRVVLHVGHLREGRNLRVLASIAAWPGVTAVLAASSLRGPESEPLRHELEAHGVVVIDGYVPNVEELYRVADCYVFPMVSPGSAVALPLSILEALASDLPVVSTSFGALSERFGSAPGLELVENPALLPDRVLAACDSRVRTRHLVEPYAWDAVAGRLVGLLDEMRLDDEDGSIPGAARGRVIAARLRRVVVDRRELPRAVLWGRHPGFQARPATAPVVAVEDALPPPAPASPQCAEVGVIGLEAGDIISSVGAAAGFLGLPVEAAAQRATTKLIDRALTDRWRLIAAVVSPSQPLPMSLAAFVGRGGTLYLDGLDEDSNQALRRFGEALDVALPQVRRASAAGHLLFPGDRAGFARELAGTRLQTACGQHALEPAADEDVLAWSLAGKTRQAAVVQRRAGRGRIVLNVLPLPAADLPGKIMQSDEAGAFVVPLLLLRELYGQAAWHAPAVLANFTIDDPALRRGLLGLRYDLLTAQARDHGFHVTIATVPRELTLADEAVVRRLRDQPGLLSACYQGCDHDGYEFYLTSGTRTRHSPRPLEKQRAALWRAIDHGRRFASAHDYQLDRVMVFPYGVGPASLFGDIHRLGFVAACNFGDRYPLEAPIPAQPDLGLRPADLAWEGFPLLWRRRLRDDGYLLDLVLGRPVLLFAHRGALGRDFAPLAKRARVINRATHGAAMWRGMDEVARHAYLQRSAPGAGWEVLMTANEACLHNPDPDPRTYVVTRPHLPEETVIDVDGEVHDIEGPLKVTVPPQGTAVVRLVAGGAVSALPGRRHCTVFGPAAGPARPDPTLEWLDDPDVPTNVWARGGERRAGRDALRSVRTGWVRSYVRAGLRLGDRS